MKLGVFTVLLGNRSLDDALRYLSGLGVQAVEIGCGGYPGKAHADPEQLLADEAEFHAFADLFKKYNLEISALSCHGNPFHPQREQAEAFQRDFEQTVLLAEKLGVGIINTFSGCPGGSPQDQTPNWVTCPWPSDFLEILEYQWNDVLIPYWEKAVQFARDHGVNKIALEMHPGFAVYNPETLLKLRQAVGEEIGANFDPSHLIWQGIDPTAAIRKLNQAIFHFHAKDTKVDPFNTAVNGVLDIKHYGDEANRSWLFRTIGYGNSAAFWKDIVSTLRMVGYDYVLSIEHEDSLMSVNEGLQKAVAFLQDVLIFEDTNEMWWA